MSYDTALTAAGCSVLKYKEFGSYQGDWWALIKTKENELGWVNGAFGSCSGCDALQAEIGWEPYSDQVKETEEYNNKLKIFGESYLSNIMNQREAIYEASRNLDWDMEAKDMVEFIKEVGSLFLLEARNKIKEKDII